MLFVRGRICVGWLGLFLYGFLVCLNVRKGGRSGLDSDDFGLRKTQTEITGRDTLVGHDIKNTARRRCVRQRLINFVLKNFFQHEICAGVSAKTQVKRPAFMRD